MGDGTAAKKKGSEALLRRRWVKVNSCTGSGFPPSLMAIALSLLPFPADGSLTSSEGGEREASEVLFRSGEGERV